MKSDDWKNQREIIPTDTGESLSKSEIERMLGVMQIIDIPDVDDVEAFIESLPSSTERI